VPGVAAGRAKAVRAGTRLQRAAREHALTVRAHRARRRHRRATRIRSGLGQGKSLRSKRPARQFLHCLPSRIRADRAAGSAAVGRGRDE
jgi:hypothetical protein